MKVCLISPYKDITSFGMRTLSAIVKKEHPVRKIFLRSGIEKNKKMGYIYNYDDKIIDQTIRLCKGYDIIGIGLTTSYFDRVAHLTEKLKSNLDIPIIWGGIHPTIRPNECLEYADMLCIGEGEEAIPELLKKMDARQDFKNVRNIWFKKNGEIIKNPVRPLVADLDSLPLPDYDLDDDYILITERIVKIGGPIEIKPYMPHHEYKDRRMLPDYRTMVSRGCPYDCTYCFNNWFKQLYKGDRHLLRRRSNEHVIKELKGIKERFSFIKLVLFCDDYFTCTSAENLKKFSEMYKKEVNLPFCCITTPSSITEEKIKYLVDAGMYRINIGIQSGSPRTQALYKRTMFTNDSLIKTSKIINKFKSRMAPPQYDIILDNPYETAEDYIETLKLVQQIPRPYELLLYSLVFFPSEINEMARRDGFIKDEKKQVYRNHFTAPKGSYINLLFALHNNKLIPVPLLKKLSNKKLVKFFNKQGINLAPLFLYKANQLGDYGIKGGRMALRLDFPLLKEYYNRWRGK